MPSSVDLTIQDDDDNDDDSEEEKEPSAEAQEAGKDLSPGDLPPRWPEQPDQSITFALYPLYVLDTLCHS